MSSSSLADQPDPVLALDAGRNLCAVGPRSWVLSGVVLQLIRQHFADPLNIEDPALRDLVWTAGPATALVIELRSTWKAEFSMRRPAVVVERLPLAAERLGIADRVDDDEYGGEVFSRLRVGGHKVSAIGATEMEAERLADEVERDMGQFADAVRRYFGLHRFRPTGLGAPAPLEEASPDAWAVSATIEYSYEECWTVQQQAPILNRVALAISTAAC